MDKLILGARIVEYNTSHVLASFEGANWIRDFKLVFNTYYKDNTEVKWDIQILRKTTNRWFNDTSILANINQGTEKL